MCLDVLSGDVIQLRQSIRDNQPLKWDYAEHPVYMEYKRLGPVISYMVRSGRNVNNVTARQQREAWIDVTDNRHENFWLKPGTGAEARHR
ncbi:MAG TPA: hypothetical protein VMB34_26030 [Acetobacteraceae bacterium]|nr:hypothetical protein [Acetobacteraceae bacterium]